MRTERGAALVVAFSMALLLLGLIASLYWVTVQHHVLMHKRVEHARMLYLAEAGVNDAMAKLRTGTISRAIVAPYSYCLNPTTGAVSGPPCAAPSAAFPVRVVVAVQNALGFNQIDVTTVNF